MNSNSFVIGTDIGGSHITAGIIDACGGNLDDQLLIRSRMDTSGSVEYILNLWSATILKAMNGREGRSTKLGIAIPGPFNYDKGISLIQGQGKFDALYGLNVKGLLAGYLNIDENSISLMNDAACFLQGEAFRGAAQDSNRAIGITLGTGLGSAFFADGTATDADLWRHPFKDGMAEDYLCTRWFVNTYRHLSGYKVSGVKDLVEQYHSDSLVKSLFKDFSQNLAEFLTFFIRREDPQVVVLGGNITKAYHLFITDLKKHLAAYDIVIPIVPAELGEQAAMIGAASYWLQKQVHTEINKN